MAIDKAIDSGALDASLTAVADAIRAKGGTNAALAFPDGFVSAIGAISTGSGAGNPNWGLGSNAVPSSLSGMFYALENGTAKTGKLTLTSVLPNAEYALVFETGLDTLTGLLIYISDLFTGVYENNSACIAFALSDGSVIEGDTSDNADYYNGTLKFYGMKLQGTNFGSQGSNWTGKLEHGVLKFENGSIYGKTINTWNNRLYSALATNVEYSWIAW